MLKISGHQLVFQQVVRVGCGVPEAGPHFHQVERHPFIMPVLVPDSGLGNTIFRPRMVGQITANGGYPLNRLATDHPRRGFGQRLKAFERVHGEAFGFATGAIGHPGYHHCPDYPH